MSTRARFLRQFLGGTVAALTLPVRVLAEDDRIVVDGDGKHISIMNTTVRNGISVEGRPESVTITGCYLEAGNAPTCVSLGR